jgi:hypothetical protein
MMNPETAKPATVSSEPALNFEQLGGPLNLKHRRALADIQDQDSRREFVLASLRCTCLRIKLIEKEIAAVGTALKGELISPDMALEWAEAMAPGCIGFIPNTANGSWSAC